MLVKLGDIAEVSISNVDKKSKPNEKNIKLCNFVDVYKNYAITNRMINSFMDVTASNQLIEKFSIKKGYLAITKDSETRDDIGVGTYFADEFENTLLGYHCALIKPNNKVVYSKYLNAFMQSPFVRKYYELNATGSGQRYTLTLDTILSTPILLPSYDKQIIIGNLLSNIDYQIEKNNTMINKLQVLSQAIFNKFFTSKIYDFNSILSEICKFPSGYAFEPSYYNENGKYKLITIKNVNGIFVDSQKTDCLSTIPSKMKSYCILEQGDILLSLTGNVGRISINTLDDALLNQRVSKMICDDKYKFYIYILLNTKYYQEKLQQLASGTSQKNLSPLDVERLKIYIPDNIMEFNNSTECIFNQMCKINLETIKLQQLKNKLLPLLINQQLS